MIFLVACKWFCDLQDAEGVLHDILMEVESEGFCCFDVLLLMYRVQHHRLTFVCSIQVTHVWNLLITALRKWKGPRTIIPHLSVRKRSSRSSSVTRLCKNGVIANKMEKRDVAGGVVLRKGQMVQEKHVTEKWGDGRIRKEECASVCLSDWNWMNTGLELLGRVRHQDTRTLGQGFS